MTAMPDGRAVFEARLRAIGAKRYHDKHPFLVFKTDVLWVQLNALWSAYVEPGRIPPGAWRPGEGVL